MKIKENTKTQYLMVLSGNMIALGSGFIITIVATNVMMIVDYGFYKAFLNALQMLASLSHLGFHYTLGRQFAIANTIQERKKLNSTGILIMFSISLVVTIGIFVVSLFLKLFLGNTLPLYVLLASVFAFILLFQYYFQQKLQGENKMTKYTVLSILPIVLLAIFFVIMLIFRVKLVASGVIAAYVLFNGITLFFLNIEHGFSLKMGFPVKEVLSKNSKYGFQLYVGLLFSVTTAQLLNLLIVNISGLEEYALFALGISLASPMTYVATTMGTVQFKKNVQAKFIKKKEIIITLVISIVAIIGYYIFLNFIIPNLIGHEFIKAIPYANILLFYHTIMGLGDYFNRFVCAKGKGILLRNGAIVSGIVLIISAIVLVPTFKVNGLIIAKIISASVYLVAMIVAYKKTIVIGGKNLD